MRITQEVHYAIRIVQFLANRENEIVGAPLISEKECISERFTSGILRKLNISGITESRRGTTGGHRLKMKKEEISLYDIVLAIYGPIVVSRGLDEEAVKSGDDKIRGNSKINGKLMEIQEDIIDTFSDIKITEII